MHELSIAQSLIEAASQAAQDEGSSAVLKINLRIGPLCGVVEDALRFSFDLAAEGTLCHGAVLVVETTTVSVVCPKCDATKTLGFPFHFVCPTCGAATPQLTGGREMELVSIEIEPNEVAEHEAARS